MVLDMNFQRRCHVCVDLFIKNSGFMECLNQACVYYRVKHSLIIKLKISPNHFFLYAASCIRCCSRIGRAGKNKCSIFLTESYTTMCSFYMSFGLQNVIK